MGFKAYMWLKSPSWRDKLLEGRLTAEAAKIQKEINETEKKKEKKSEKAPKKK